MVLFYSGTGNSEYVAKRIATALDDKCENLFERLSTQNNQPISSDTLFVIVAPTYGWQIPHILRDWLKGTELNGSKDIYFVLTCGGEIGNAEEYLKKLCLDKGLNFRGCAEIVMPENYIAIFGAPEEKEALGIIEKAEPKIDEIIQMILANKAIPSKKVGIADKLKSGIVNAVYYPLIIHSKKFLATDACIGCGKCEKACVMNNISLINGRPKWNDSCTHCMACICGCPTKAIEYGKASIGKPRYQCPKKL